MPASASEARFPTRSPTKGTIWEVGWGSGPATASARQAYETHIEVTRAANYGVAISESGRVGASAPCFLNRARSSWVKPRYQTMKPKVRRIAGAPMAS